MASSDLPIQAGPAPARSAADDYRLIRLGWADQHGILRSKTLTIAEYKSSLERGKDFPSLTIFDTTNHPIFNPFTSRNFLDLDGIDGLPDCLLVPDPPTLRPVPWSEGAALVLGDMHLKDGRLDPLCTRGLLKRQLQRLGDAGFELVVGIELEFYVFRMLDASLAFTSDANPSPPPMVTGMAHGHQYMSDSRTDELASILDLLRACLTDMNLPLAGLDAEWGPGQCELTLAPLPALAAADAVMTARTAIKQVCRRHGYHATFMTAPNFPGILPSGWHLHQSLLHAGTRTNAMTPASPQQFLSATGMKWLGGLLAHAAATSLLSTPTLNGYKRRLPGGLSPTSASWGHENRGAMARVIGGVGRDDTRLENRIGDPAANPYLFIAAQIVSGLDGLEHGLDPGPEAASGHPADAPPLPRTLIDALAAFRASALLPEALGAPFVRYFTHLKQCELDRFLSAVTDWEQAEYFEVY